MKRLKSAKMFVVGFLACLLLVGTTVIAANAITSATFNANRVIFNGQELNLDMPLVSIVTADNPGFFSNYMPVRAVLEAMGYAVDWDSINNAVIVTNQQVPPQDQVQTGDFIFSTSYATRHNSIMNESFTHTVAEITNNSGVNFGSLIIGVTYFAADGTILGRGQAFVLNLQDGETRSFESIASGNFANADRVVFQVDVSFEEGN